MFMKTSNQIRYFLDYIDANIIAELIRIAVATKLFVQTLK